MALIVAAFSLRNRPRPASEHPTANPWLVGAVAFGLLAQPVVGFLSPFIDDRPGSR